MPETRTTEANDVIERRFIPMEAAEIRIAAGDDGEKKIVGYAAMFNSWSENLGWFREKIKPGAFATAIQNDDVRALFNHNPDVVLGRNRSGTLKLREDERGLWMEVTPPDTQQARDLMTLIERGDVSQQSFAFAVEEEEWVMGKDKELDERTLVKVRLFDVSPVTYPAYPDTSVALRSKQQRQLNDDNGRVSRIRSINTRIYEARLAQQRGY